RTTPAPGIFAHRRPSAKYLEDDRPQIRAGPHPPHADLRPRVGNSRTARLKPEQIRKVHAGAPAKGMPPPNAGIDVQQFVLPIASVVLELDLHDAGEFHGLEH